MLAGWIEAQKTLHFAYAACKIRFWRHVSLAIQHPACSVTISQGPHWEIGTCGARPPHSEPQNLTSMQKNPLLSTFANYSGQLQWILILLRLRTLQAPECLVMPCGRKLIGPNANFVLLASFNGLQKCVWGKWKWRISTQRFRRVQMLLWQLWPVWGKE